MTPKILDYDQGRIIVTAEAFMIPELKAIIDKYGLEAEPYLGYIHLMTWMYSPYRNADINEKEEQVVYDVINSIGDFDIDEPLLRPALSKMTQLNTTALSLFFLEIEQELHRMRIYLKNNEITGGKDGDLADRFRILKEAGAITASYNKAKTAAEEEMKLKGRGKATIGDY